MKFKTFAIWFLVVIVLLLATYKVFVENANLSFNSSTPTQQPNSDYNLK
jgi:hypothetical protein